MNNINFDFEDHFSLKSPSANVRFRGKNVHIYDLANDQLQLEHRLITADEDGDDQEKGGGLSGENDNDGNKIKIQIAMKRMRGGSLGLRILRGLYTLAALLMFGFLFVFSAQMVAYYIMEIPHPNDDLKIGTLLSSIAALPVMVYSMSSLMVFGMVFIGDTWNGQ